MLISILTKKYSLLAKKKVLEMEELIFSFASNVEDTETLVLVESIRKFAGRFAKSPIWLFTTKEHDEISEERRKQLETLNVIIKQLDLDSEIAKFPFTGHVRAAAQAEEEAKTKTNNLVFLGTNSMVIQEPKGFILKEGISLGYRPVHHRLIGSLYNEPIDTFWELVYQKCDVSTDKLFPMKTHVDGNILRPYINSGYLIVNPKRGFLGYWWEYYENLYKDPDFEEFYKNDDLYVTFIHQAVLSAVMLVFLSALGLGQPCESLESFGFPVSSFNSGCLAAGFSLVSFFSASSKSIICFILKRNQGSILLNE